MILYRFKQAALVLSLTLVCVALTSNLQSCATAKRIAAGEPASLDDATPPPNYNPNFIKQITQLPSDPALNNSSTFEITRIDARDPNRVKVIGHLTDNSGTYLSGAAAGKWKNKWCGLTDQSDGRTRNITKYSLKEVTAMDRIPTALALVMDHSGSMGEERALAIQNAAESLINKKKPEDALALVKYDDAVKLECGLTRDANLLRSSLQKTGLLGYGGGTAITDGAAKGIEILSLDKTYERRAVLLFTDGLENSSSLNKDSLLQVARKQGIFFCVIGFGENIDEPFLQTFSSSTGGMYKKIYRTNEMEALFEDIYHRLRNYYVFEYAPPTYGLHNVSLKICLPGDTLVAQGSYDNTPNIGDVSLLDINFALDKADIPAASTATIDDVVTLLKAFPSLNIRVQGHTDNTNNTGDPDHNRKLSQRRADAVKAALTRKGIAGSRISAQGLGDTQPVGDNTTEEGRARNRRTEFVIVSR